jgi:erythrin-vacuolar iron transport family protein
VGGVFHTLPFLASSFHVALVAATIVVAVELLTLAWLRWRFFHTGFVRSLISVAGGGAIIAGLSAVLGIAAGSG